jgi:hypothetical protein
MDVTVSAPETANNVSVINGLTVSGDRQKTEPRLNTLAGCAESSEFPEHTDESHTRCALAYRVEFGMLVQRRGAQ